MKGLLTLARLEPSERSLALRTLLLVAVVRVALWFVPFERVRSFARSSNRLPFSVSREISIRKLVWAVKAASRRIPWASCLTQSVALHSLLLRGGHDSQIHIGVAKEPKTGFEAHAWVEHAGQPLLSSPSELYRYTRLVTLEEERI